MTLIRRGRGLLLRLARRRLASALVGLALVAPAAWMQLQGGSDTWWAEGLSLVAAASGVALLWNGLFGVKPDWRD